MNGFVGDIFLPSTQSQVMSSLIWVKTMTLVDIITNLLFSWQKHPNVCGVSGDREWGGGADVYSFQTYSLLYPTPNESHLCSVTKWYSH